MTLLCDLESSLGCMFRPLPLIVRVIHKSRLRYYGKPGLKINYPYQVRHKRIIKYLYHTIDQYTVSSLLNPDTIINVSSNVVSILYEVSHQDFMFFFSILQAYFEVADQSGTMSLVLWNELCPEWYQRLNVGTVLYLQNYTLKQSYQNRSRPHIDNHRMKSFHSVGTELNLT